MKDVSFDVRSGEVHVLVGENGAGKSTLIKILSGYLRPTAGQIYINGTKVIIENPRHAHHLGIRAIYQEFSLVPQLSVMENIFLGIELTSRKLFLNKRKMSREAIEILKSLDWVLDPARKIRSLGIAELQMIEIAKALIQEFSLLILDEPTASLTSKETERLFEIINKLKGQGKGIIYISHRLEEIRSIADRVTVMRDGIKTATLDNGNVKEDTLIKLMTGRETKERFPKIESSIANEVLSVEGMTTERGLKEITFKLHKGEILGITGLVGSGKSQIGKALFGLDKLKRGQIKLFGKIIKNLTPGRMLENGVQYFPNDRHREGLILDRSLKENITISSVKYFEALGILRKKKEVEITRNIVTRMGIKPSHLDKKVRHFSGGNQQKILLARSLVRKVDVFIFDDPTRGVDVGAKIDIYNFFNEILKNGAAIILISSEIPEVLNLSHRIMVISDFVVSNTFSSSEASEQKIQESFFKTNKFIMNY